MVARHASLRLFESLLFPISSSGDDAVITWVNKRYTVKILHVISIDFRNDKDC